MADKLTPSEQIEKQKQKKAENRKRMKAYMIRASEPGAAVFVSPLLGAINRAKPEWKEVAYGLVQPNAVATGLGIAGLLLFRKSPALWEGSMGTLMAGGVPLMHDVGAKLYDLITG